MAGRSLDYTANLKADDQITPAAEKAADALDKLEGKGDVSVKFKGDASQIAADIEGVLRLVDQVGGDAATLVLTSNADAITGQIGDLVLEMNKLEDPVQIDIKVDQIQALEAGLGQLSAKAKEVVTETGGMSGAMSNAFGNAAQDLAGLAGITGSAGQAIGQLSDQFITAASGAGGLKSALGGLAASAAPIAGIAAVVGLVTSILGEYQAAAEASAAETKAFGAAMADSGNDALGFADVIRENEDSLRHFAASANSNLGDFGIAVEKTFEKIPLLGSLVDETSTDVVAAMGKASLSVYDLGTALDDNIGGMAGFIAKLQEAKNAGQISGEEFRALKEAATEMNGEVQKAAETQALYNVNQAEANALLQAAKDPLTQNAEAWATLEADMADGTINTEAAAQAMNTLATATGMSREQIIGIAQTDIDKKMEATAEATAKAAEAAQQYAQVVSSTDWQMSQIQGAVTAYSQLAEQQFGLVNIASNTQAAYDSLNASIEENGFTFDNTTEKGRANGEQIQNLYSSLIPQLSAAFADAGGSIETFGGNMDTLRAGVFQQLSEQTSLTADQINNVIDQLGVFDGTTYSSTFELLAIEDANAKLALLSGMLGSLPPEVQQQIIIDVLAGDPYAALGEIERAVGAPGAAGEATVPVVPGADTATPYLQGVAATDWTTSVALTVEEREAQAAVDVWIATVAMQQAQIALDADPTNADAARDLWIATANVATAQAHLDAERSKADAQTNAWVDAGNAATPVGHLDAEHSKADAQTQAWIGIGNAATAVGTQDATAAPATAVSQAWWAASNRLIADATVNAHLGSYPSASSISSSIGPVSVLVHAVLDTASSFFGGGSGGGKAGKSATSSAAGQPTVGATGVVPGTTVTYGVTPAVHHVTAPVHVNVAAPVIPPIKINLDGKPVAALVQRTTAPIVRAAAMTIRAGRA